jgi:cytochrome c peroxidase
MPFLKRSRLGLSAVAAFTGTALILGGGCNQPDGSSANESMTNGTSRQSHGKAPPIPKAGPLANPRPIQQLGLPVELTRKAIPSDNPQTPEKISLGEKLFFDGRLSADGTVACATCHDPARAFTDGRPVSIGIHGRVGQRNAPTSDRKPIVGHQGSP